MSRQRSTLNAPSSYPSRRRVASTPLQRVSRSRRIPASFFQEAYYIKHVDKPTGYSNIITLNEIGGNINEMLFCEVFEEVLKRHEIFRTYFELGQDKVYQ